MLGPTLYAGMKRATAEALASMVPEPSSARLLPGPFDAGVAATVAAAVRATA